MAPESKNRVSGINPGPGELNREVSRLGDVGSLRETLINASR